MPNYRYMNERAGWLAIIRKKNTIRAWYPRRGYPSKSGRWNKVVMHSNARQKARILRQIAAGMIRP